MGKSGASLEAHLRQVAETEGVDLEDLVEVAECPPLLEYLWEFFLELHFARPSGFGPGPLAYEGIWAWCKLRGVRLTPWEVSAVKMLDALYLKEAHAHGSRKPNPAGE